MDYGPEARAHTKGAVAPELAAVEDPADVPTLIFGKTFPTYWYTDALVKYPTVFFCLYYIGLIVLALISLALNPDISTSSSALSIADHWSQRNVEAATATVDAWIAAYNAELQNTRGASFGVSDAVTQATIDTRLYVTYKVNAAKYLASSQASVPAAQDLLGTSANIEFIRSIESRLRTGGNLPPICWRSPFRGTDADLDQLTYFGVPSCTPFTSLMTYLYPGTMQNLTGRVYWDFDGLTGSQQQPISEMKKIIFSNPRAQWFTDQSASYSNPQTSLLRTQIAFGTPYANPSAPAGYVATKKNYIDFFINTLTSASHAYIDVGFGGDGVEAVLVLRAVNRDANLVIPAAVLLICIFWYHFHSLILSLFLVAQVGLTYSAGFAIWALTTKAASVSLLSSMSLFVVIMISTNAAMIIFDTFKQSGVMSTTGRRNLLSVSQRMAYTFRKAGVGVTVASLVAAICFGISSLSKVPAVSSFSTITIVMICVNWLLMMTLFPSSILFHHFHISGRRRNLQRQKEILLARGLRRRDPNMMLFLAQEREMQERFGVPAYKDVKAYMDGELDHEVQQRGTRGGVWGALGIQAPVRLTNPFARRVVAPPSVAPAADDIEMDGGEPDQPNASLAVQQDMLDQFQDAPKETATPAAVSRRGAPRIRQAQPDDTILQFDHRNIDLTATFRVTNISAEELLGFDDNPVRFRLVELGATTPTALEESQLGQLAPVIGIEPQGAKAASRLSTMVRQAIVLMYGGGRSLHRPSEELTHALEEHVEAQQAQQRAQTAPPTTAAPIRNTKVGFTKRIADWWAERRSVERKWCCGMLGQRVGETQEEMEARIMSKRVKHEGYSRAELLFFNVWAPAVHALRFVIMGIAAAWIVVAIVFTALLQPSSTPPDLIGDSPVTAFNQLTPQFGQSGNCDYCSAFFQPLSAFPKVSAAAVAVCAATSLGGQMMTAWLDQCGVCRGTNACLDCRGVANGPYVLDKCGQCLLPSDPSYNACTSCSVVGNIDSGMNCSYCFVRAGAAFGYTGANCKKQCDPAVNCLPANGKCNAVTGSCECYQDFVHGFWKDDFFNDQAPHCSVCMNGFAGPSCMIECNASTGTGDPCNCNVNTSRCTTCNYGLVGSNCAGLVNAYCGNGFLSPFGTCECVPGYNPADGCNTELVCSGRGLTFTALQLGPGDTPGCRCYGQWRGPTCNLCKCYNGGTCAKNGTCICQGGWSGPDCQQCSGTCLLRGVCPLPYPLAVYPTSICRALRCSDAELFASFTSASSPCSACDGVGVTAYCSSFASPTTCAGSTGAACEWDAFSASCRSAVHAAVSSNYSTCKCNGQWSGAQCTTCNNAAFPGTTCAERTGVLLGCDGQPSTSGQYKVVDNCGTCGGSTSCTGCDGIAGSGKKLDLCGVCGGDNSCAAAAGANGGLIVRPTSLITIVFGTRPDGSADPEFDFADGVFQSHLQWICVEFGNRNDLVKTSQSRCLMRDFAAYMLGNHGLAVPYPSTINVHAELYRWLVNQGRLDEAGFTGTDPTSPNFRVLWIRVSVRAADMYDDSSIATQTPNLALWQKIMDNINLPSTRGKQGTAYMASEAWVRYFTQLAFRNGAAYILVVSSVIFVAVLLSVTVSPTLAAIAAVTLTSNILTVLSIFRMLEWTLGPVELVALALLMGLAGEQLVHMSEGYLEYLHAAQSHVFALETSRLQAVKGMYQRTGVSTLLSGVTVLLASCFLFLAEVLVIRRVAAVMIILMLSLLVHTLIVQGALMCAVGPVVSYRNRLTVLAFAGSSAVVCAVVLGLLLGLRALTLI